MTEDELLQELLASLEQAAPDEHEPGTFLTIEVAELMGIGRDKAMADLKRLYARGDLSSIDRVYWRTMSWMPGTFWV